MCCVRIVILNLFVPILATAIGCAPSSGVTKATTETSPELEKCLEMVRSYDTALADVGGTVGRQVIALELAEQRLESFRAIAGRLRKNLSDQEISFQVRKGRLIVILPNHILFESGKYTPRQEAESVLSQMALVIKDTANRDLLIVGHTDNVPISKKDPSLSSNRELSMLRAMAIADRLEKLGVPSARMGRVGFGEFRPVATNDTDMGRSQNRRTEVVILPLPEEIPQAGKASDNP